MTQPAPLDLTRLSAAKLWLTAAGSQGAAGDMPYLSSVIYSMTSIASNEIRALSADDRWRLYVNPDWLMSTDIPDIGVELAHVCWHLLRDHAGRARSMGVGRPERSHWQTAADATVAETLIASSLPNPGLRTPTALGLPPERSAEEYYAAVGRLPVRLKPDDGRPDAGTGATDGEDDAGCGSAADGLSRSYEPPLVDGGGVDGVRAEQIRRSVAIEFRQHMTARGTEPGEWSRWVEQVLEPVVPWQRVLASALRRAIAWVNGHSDYTYRRPSRRQAASPKIVLPAMHSPTPTVAILVDSSGSVDDGLLAAALAEIDGVLRALGSGTDGVSVLTCDAAVHTVSKVRRARDVSLVGGGGTDMRPGIAASSALRPRPEILIVLTDGYTPWPDHPPRGTTVIAALLGRDREELPDSPSWAQRVECLPSP